jgi:drug/metabolite transporter (DMT)-like permease
MIPIMFYVFAWGSVSSTLIILNARLLQEDGFHYPMTLCSMGLGASWIISVVLIWLGVVKLKKAKPLRASWYIKNTLPLGGFSATSLALGNYSYLHLSVPFIQMLKAGGPCVAMTVLFCLGLERPNPKMVVGVIILSLGTALAVYGEMAFNWTGTFFMLGSEMAEAFRLALLQHLTVNLKFGLVEGLYRATPATLGFLGVGICLFERDVLSYGHGGIENIVARPHLYLSVAVLGFFVNLLTFAVIKSAGSLALKICGQLRNAVIILSGVYLFGSIISLPQVVGYSFSFLGMVVYQLGRQKNGLSR